MTNEQFWREPSDQNKDIFDETLNRNPDIVDIKPYSDGKKFVGKKEGKRCKLCTRQYDVKLDKCPDCHCPDFEPIEPKFPVDVIPLGPTAQYRKKLETCWNRKENADGEITKHHFDEIKVKVITVLPVMVGGTATSSYELHLEVRCKQCSMPYQRINGRAATDEEIADFKAGKIEKASKFMGYNWVG